MTWTFLFCTCRILNPWLQPTSSLWSSGSSSCPKRCHSLTQWMWKLLCRTLVRSPFCLTFLFYFFSPDLKVRWNGQVMVRSPLLSVLPTVTGTCDQNQFYISVTYGSQGSNFQTIVGPRQLSPEMANAYNFQENATHFSLIVPYNAIDTAFEVCQETETPELNNFFFFLAKFFILYWTLEIRIYMHLSNCMGFRMGWASWLAC